MPERYRIVGVSRGTLSDDEMRATALLSLQMFGPKRTRRADRVNFCHRIVGANYEEVPEVVARAEREIGGRPRRLFHLAVPPAAFETVVEKLQASGLSRRARVIIEKPFGTDLASARELNRVVHSVFDERTSSGSTTSSAGRRCRTCSRCASPTACSSRSGTATTSTTSRSTCPRRCRSRCVPAFYEGTGAFRDMVVTHLFQVLGFVAMEPPTSLEPKALRVEKNKVFESMQPLDPARVVRGQYDGYRDEQGVSPRSETETFVALEVEIDNWRWEGVPFYLRSGKRMAESRQTISLAFREPPRRMFRLAQRAAGIAAAERPHLRARRPGLDLGLASWPRCRGRRCELGEAHMTFQYDELVRHGASSRPTSA